MDLFSNYVSKNPEAEKREAAASALGIASEDAETLSKLVDERGASAEEETKKEAFF